MKDIDDYINKELLQLNHENDLIDLFQMEKNELQDIILFHEKIIRGGFRNRAFGLIIRPTGLCSNFQLFCKPRPG